MSGDTDTFRYWRDVCTVWYNYIIRHKWAAGDPGVRSLDRQPWCSNCKSPDHFTRSCRVGVLGPMGREIQVMVMSLLCSPENEPESQKGLLDTLW